VGASRVIRLTHLRNHRPRYLTAFFDKLLKGGIAHVSAELRSPHFETITATTFRYSTGRLSRAALIAWMPCSFQSL
jgi:hypothetical protein